MAHYAWGAILYGGETEMRERQNGVPFKVVTKRNKIEAGEKVTQKELGVSNEEWEALIEGGSVRSYPYPEGTDAYTSPAAAMMAKLVDDTGSVDVNKLIEMGLSHPPVINPPAEAAATPKGV